MNYYDDNYGDYECGYDDDPEEVAEFYRQTQAASVWKKCKRCGRRVHIRADYAICNSCADQLERGYDY
jgi:hypothetical protein